MFMACRFPSEYKPQIKLRVLKTITDINGLLLDITICNQILHPVQNTN